MTIKALIFDVDGTLAETERDGHRIAFNRAFAASGLDWHWDAQQYGELLVVTGGKEQMLHYWRTPADCKSPAYRTASERATPASPPRHQSTCARKLQSPAAER